MNPRTNSPDIWNKDQSTTGKVGNHTCMDVLVYTVLHSGHLSVSVYGSQDFLSKKYTGCRICTKGLLNVFDRKSVMNQVMPNALKTKLYF